MVTYYHYSSHVKRVTLLSLLTRQGKAGRRKVMIGPDRICIVDAK
jgi:hypothetical protein